MKILVKCVAGSHLFGTNTPESDKDFKGVFLPEPSDILLGKFDQTIHDHTNNEAHTKNTKDDVDVEFYSLDKFLKMLYQGQTVAWELLFTPDQYILEKHPVWDEIRAATPRFLNKKVDSFIGYCKQQAHKYGTRGSRMNTLETVLKILEKYTYTKEIKSARTNWSGKELVSDHNLGDIWKHEMDNILKLEHVEFVPDKNGKDLIHICGKKFGLDTNLAYVVQPLIKYYDDYGDRSRLAKENKGIDWKALSHAVRVCMQASSLLKYGEIRLPMHPSQVALLKEIKAGQLSFEVVANLIEEYQNDMLNDRETSTLRNEPDLAAFQEIQCDIYKRLIKGDI